MGRRMVGGLAFAAALLVALPATATVSIEQTGKINNDTDPAYTHIAPMLRANPANPNHLVLADVKRTGSSANTGAFGQCLVRASLDRGRTWSPPAVLQVLEGMQCRRSPVPTIAFGSGNNLYASYYVSPSSPPPSAPSSVSSTRVDTPAGPISVVGASASPIGRTVVAKSTDGGITFGAPVIVPTAGLEDVMQNQLGYGPNVTVASFSNGEFGAGVGYSADAIPRNVFLTADPDTNDVWVAWAAPRWKVAVLVSRSRDGGATFESPTIVPLPLAYLATHFNPWLIYRVSLTFVEGRLHLAVNYMSCPDQIDPRCFFAPTVMWWFKLAWAVSDDRGATFTEPKNIASWPVWDYVGQLPPAPPLAVDPSNPDRIYIGYEDQINGDVSKENYIVRSADGGRTWSAPIRMGTDSADAGIPHERLALSVAPNGRVDAAWYDGRNDPSSTAPNCVPGDEICAGRDVWYTYSLDGGATWAPEIRVTPEMFEARSRRIDQQLGGNQSAQESFGGIGIVSRNDGVSLVWEQSGPVVTVPTPPSGSRAVPIWDLYGAEVTL